MPEFTVEYRLLPWHSNTELRSLRQLRTNQESSTRQAKRWSVDRHSLPEALRSPFAHPTGPMTDNTNTKNS